MPTNRAGSIATLEATNAALTDLVANIDDPTLDFRLAPADWSIREILAHFVDDEMYVMRTRFERIIKEDAPHLAPHDEKRWYETRNITRDSLADLLADFQIQRSASLGMITMQRESDFARTGFQPEYGHFSAEEWLARWAEHDTVHLNQIETTLKAYQAQT